MTLCHEGLEIVNGVWGGGERSQATPPLAEAVEGKSCTQMVTGRHAKPSDMLLTSRTCCSVPVGIPRAGRKEGNERQEKREDIDRL